jgi:hypothetical protein
MANTYFIRPSIAVNLDTATFPAHTIIDISSTVVSGDVQLSIDSDCGTANVLCTEKNSAADDRVRLYFYLNGSLFFNGEIVGATRNADTSYSLKGQDVLARLKKRWGGADRTYGAGNLPDPSTDTNTVQNIAEASSVDASLTDIEGADFPIGITADIVIKGGTPDPLALDKPAQGDVMLDLVRELDQGVVPNYCTFTTGAGVVTRRPREIGTSVATFTSSSQAWDWNNDHDVNTIQNKATIIGKTIANIPTQAYAQASNSYLVAPFEYNPVTVNTPRVIETEVDAQALADWVVGERNGRLHKVTFTTPITTTEYLAKTITLNHSAYDLSSQDVLVVGLHHHFDERTATTTFTCEYRD